MLPEMRKPPVGKTDGLLEIEKLAGTIDTPECSPILPILQAEHVRRRHRVSWPIAKALAEMQFGGAS